MNPLPKSSGIYAIVNTISSHCYVGSAVNMHTRGNNHLRLLRKGTHTNSHLQNAFACYGEESFILIVAEDVSDRHQLLIREQYYIDTMCPAYNIAPIAGSQLGLKHSEASRMKMARSHLGVPLGEEHRRNLAASIQSEETRKRMSESHKGKKHSDEHREWLSEFHRTRQRKPFSEEAKKNLSSSHIGLTYGPCSQERKDKLSARFKGVPLSEEHREALRQAWVRRRARQNGETSEEAS